MAIKIEKKHFSKNSYETQAWASDKLVCGIDEVARGCIAGPLVTAAVILPSGKSHELLVDSKTLAKRDLLIAYKWISQNCKFSIGMASNYQIDKINIWQSTLIAMKRAIIGLFEQYENIIPLTSAILVDAMPLNLSNTAYKDIPIHHFTKGESKSTSIAAASIIAKVTRDRLMEKFDTIFPGYQLKYHKGYGTKSHKKAIDKYKHSIIHRKSFLNKTFSSKDFSSKDFSYGEKNNGQQLAIF